MNDCVVSSAPSAGAGRSDRQEGGTIAVWALANGSRAIDLRAAVTRNRVIAAAALALSAALVITLPPTPVTVIAAAIATLALAVDRRLGPLPAALLVALTLPWGRGADTLTFEIAGLPLRPHDAVIAIGMLGTLPVLVRRRPTLSPTLVLLAILLALGVVAVVVGVLRDNALRDVFRDIRWWLFYGVAILALFGGTTRPKLLRGLLIGMTLFSILVVVAALLPAFPGGLKDQELLYDRGTLRMQFGNSAFLLPAIAYVAWAVLTRRRLVDAGLLGLLIGAVILSLTRTSIGASALVLGLVCLSTWWSSRRAGHLPRRIVGDVARLAVIASIAFVVGLAVDIAGTPPPAQVATSDGSGEAPIDRIFFQDDRSDIGSLAVGRFPSYRAAAAVIVANPVFGAGMGSLTVVEYAYSSARADTIGQSPGVDNAYLTVGLKTGIPGMIVLGLLVLTSLLVAIRRGGPVARWYVPAWIGLIILSMTQAYAVSLYGPFAFALMLVYPCLQRGSSVERPVAPARTGSA